MIQAFLYPFTFFIPLLFAFLLNDIPTFHYNNSRLNEASLIILGTKDQVEKLGDSRERDTPGFYSQIRNILLHVLDIYVILPNFTLKVSDLSKQVANFPT